MAKANVTKLSRAEIEAQIKTHEQAEKSLDSVLTIVSNSYNDLENKWDDASFDAYKNDHDLLVNISQNGIGLLREMKEQLEDYKNSIVMDELKAGDDKNGRF